MTLADHVSFNIAHSAWALGQLIGHAESLPREKIEEDLGIGPGGLRVNIAHAIEAMFFFADCFAGRDSTEPPEYGAQSQTLDGLRRLLATATEALRASMLGACERGLPAEIRWPGGDIECLKSPVAVAQVFDHATLHRTQAVNMLKRLGVRPVPDLDPMTFQATGLPW